MNTVRQSKYHAMSRYTCVTEGVIDWCQRDYLAGRDLAETIPDLSAADAALIAVESLEGDRLLDVPPTALLSMPLDGLGDWSLAVLAEILLSLADEGRNRDSVSPEVLRMLKDRAYAALEQALKSPTASRLVWYEDIYFDVAQQYRMRGDRQALEWMKRGLAHDLQYYEAGNAANFLRDLAETHLWLGEPEPALALFTAVLRHDPGDIWTYNSLALSLGRRGLANLGLVAAHRGLELLDATGDPGQLRGQFSGLIADLERDRKEVPAAQVDPTTTTAFLQALSLDFTARQGTPLAALCREVVPGLDAVPVKGPAMPPTRPKVAVPATGRPAHRPGRNDPCWCGSGKKYKKCHLLQDEAQGR
jgi:tetratricopeptide (TPR) repeat protein